MISSGQNFLLDTNILIWLSADLHRVPRGVLDVLEDPNTSLFVSTVSFWELTIKQSLGKIDASIRSDMMTGKYQIRELPVISRYMDTLRRLPTLHGDPFDRMLAAQALTDGMTLVTSDRKLLEYPVPLLRV